jgi:hypothetical protein
MFSGFGFKIFFFGFGYGFGTDKIEVLTCVGIGNDPTVFVLLFMKITTYAYIFSIPSYGWIRIFFRIRIHQKVSDSFGFGFGSATLIRRLGFITGTGTVRRVGGSSIFSKPPYNIKAQVGII